MPSTTPAPATTPAPTPAPTPSPTPSPSSTTAAAPTPAPTTPAPETTTPAPAPATAPEECGECTACMADNGVCYSQTQAFCDLYPQYRWCGPLGGSKLTRAHSCGGRSISA